MRATVAVQRWSTCDRLPLIESLVDTNASRFIKLYESVALYQAIFRQCPKGAAAYLVDSWEDKAKGNEVSVTRFQDACPGRSHRIAAAMLTRWCQSTARGRSKIFAY